MKYVRISGTWLDAAIDRFIELVTKEGMTNIQEVEQVLQKEFPRENLELLVEELDRQRLDQLTGKGHILQGGLYVLGQDLHPCDEAGTTILS